MLRIEHQRAGSREVESGGDSPVCNTREAIQLVVHEADGG